MRKKMGFIFGIFILLFFMIPIGVHAEEFTTTINGTEVASVNEKIDYTIEIKTDSQAVEFESTIKYDTDILELVSIIKEESWNGNNSITNSGNNTLKFTNNGITGESSVVKLRFKVKSSVKSSTTLSLEDIKLTVTSIPIEGEENSGNIVLTNSTLKKDISIKSDDNTLKNIKVDNKAIAGFTSDVLEYNLQVDSLTDKVSINATLNNAENASFVEEFGNREVSLDYGENIVLIKVKSESEKVLTYTLKIVRKDDRVANTDLKSIILNGGKIKINFDKNNLRYTIKTYKLETIDVSVETDDSTSTAEVDVPDKLIIGENKIKITVTAVTGATKEYILIIANSEVPIDTRLKHLSVTGAEPKIEFDSDTYKYYIRYDKSYKKGLTMYHTPLSNDVEVDVLGNSNLKEDSVVRIIVTSLDGSNSSEYTITLQKDTRINFFLILDVVIGVVLLVLIIIQVRKRNKKKKEKEMKRKELELSRTKEIKL